MKKFIKIFLISLFSLFGLILVIIGLALFLIFTPARVTPIIRSQLAKTITCRSEIGQVELTFFSTFPEFGIKIRNFALINPVAGSPSDTLVRADEFVGRIDAAAWWKKDQFIVRGMELKGGAINIFADSLGNTNYNIMPADTATGDTHESGGPAPVIDISDVGLNDISLRYNDLALKLNTVISKLSARISGTVREDKISGEIRVMNSVISLEYDNEKYLQDARVSLDLPLDFVPSVQALTLKNAVASVNELGFSLNGSVGNDTADRKIITDLSYRLTSWPIGKILAVVPPSYASYLKDIEADGLLSSDGTIKGSFSETAMPILDIHLLLEKGKVRYSGFPLPLSDMSGDIVLSTDLKSDSTAFVQINNFSARTPKSAFSIEGRVNHLFSDIYCDLTTSSRLNLGEFGPLIPDSLKIRLEGSVSGIIKTTFTLSQIEKMQIGKMKLSGSLTLTDFGAVYDSLSLNTGRSMLDFSLPARKPSSGKTKFASFFVTADNITAQKTGSYSASLRNASLKIESSDARDTTRIPDVICSFDIDSLGGVMDTMSIAISRPRGKFTLSPNQCQSGQPRIILSYAGDAMKAAAGQTSFTADRISFDTDILNDSRQKEIFLQWLVRGFVQLDQGEINLAGYSHPFVIPSLKMKFDPESFHIQEGALKIDRSDFRLTGDLENILSYFRGDSILRGKFDFVSGTTDVDELMALTNGIGYKDSTAAEAPEKQKADSANTGPYMVPKQMDLILNASIKTATIGADTASDIKGSIRVKDGILVLDGLTFDTPAARMQLTAIYRTPRKNHIFLGLDYHMLDVEIGELLTMIPDIDSLMPMLRSFSGKGEFHIAIETYLDSLYNIKKSTLRGASSIRGNDLVLMDGETFSEIAKTLRFNKKTQNRVDSLSAEFTIFRNEIDVYPFLIVLDKYKAIVAGRHNFDLTYDYHISLVDSPLPIKLGIDVKGNANDMSYKLAKCRYAEYYRPTARHAVEAKQLELRKLIRETLTQKVKE